MITPLATSEPPQAGPLAAPSEDELVAAYRELRDQALTLPWAAGMTRLLTSDRDRLRFRYELLHARGREAVWPDATGTIESVVVAPYDFWPEALLVSRDGKRLHVQANRAEAIDQQGRVLLDSSSEPSTAAAAPTRGESARTLIPGGWFAGGRHASPAAAASGSRRPPTRPRRLEPARHGGSRPER